MLIRDDRGAFSFGCGAPIPGRDEPAKRRIDRVLFDCPACGRSHFVTVDACPDEAEAAAETRMAGRLWSDHPQAAYDTF